MGDQTTRHKVQYKHLDTGKVPAEVLLGFVQQHIEQLLYPSRIGRTGAEFLVMRRSTQFGAAADSIQDVEASSAVQTGLRTVAVFTVLRQDEREVARSAVLLAAIDEQGDPREVDQGERSRVARMGRLPGEQQLPPGWLD